MDASNEKFNWAMKRLAEFNRKKRPKPKEIARIKMEPEYLERFYEDPVEKLIKLNQ